MQRSNWVRLALAGGLIIGTCASAAPADVVKARQNNFKAIGKATKTVFDELKNPTPSAAVIQPAAKQLAALAPQLPRWFPVGTAQGMGVKTGALPAIWAKPAEFKTAAGNFATAAAALDAAAKSGDMARVGAAARALGGTCKGCHDSFRGKEE